MFDTVPLTTSIITVKVLVVDSGDNFIANDPQRTAPD